MDNRLTQVHLKKWTLKQCVCVCVCACACFAIVIPSWYLDFERFAGSSADSLADFSDLARDTDRDRDDLACRQKADINILTT